MEGIPFIDELIKEYLLFRGYMQTFSVFTAEQNRDATRPARVGPILKNLLQHVERQELGALNELWRGLVSRVFSQLPAHKAKAAESLRESILKLYIVTAIKKNNPKAVEELFTLHASELTDPNNVNSEQWTAWLALKYVKDPKNDPRFASYFHQEWAELLEGSLRNVLDTAFREIPLPTLLAFKIHRLDQRQRQAEIRALKAKLEALQYTISPPAKTSISTPNVPQTPPVPLLPPPATPGHKLSESPKKSPRKFRKPTDEKISKEGGGEEKRGKRERELGGTVKGYGDENKESTTFHPIKTTSLKGHHSSITSIRFSGDGKRLAAGGLDGVVRVWEISEGLLEASPASESSRVLDEKAIRALEFGQQEVTRSDLDEEKLMGGRSAEGCKLVGTEFCRMPVGAVEWDPLSDELLLCGTYNSKIRLWSARQGRVLRTTAVSRDPTGRIISISCSPKRPVFVASVHNPGDVGTSSVDVYVC
ncbi:hypothetical protein AAMO2058_000497900 [Amorphochlora amoebiformis]